MNPNKRNWMVTICCFVFALMIVTIIEPNIGTAKQLQFSSSVSGYKNNIIASRYKTKVFGRQGRSGRDGRNGVFGNSGKNIRIVVDGTASNYDVSASNGSNGTDGNFGENASSCRAPRRRPPYSLRGASGGDGGDGGDGGNGGNGGNTTIFYQNLADLKKITLNNSGGEGGSPGRGAEGGDGCNCKRTEWKVNYCQWNLYKKNRNEKDAKWIFDSKKRVACTGVKRVDERENYPSPPKHSNIWAYRWEYKGVYNTQRYTCSNGNRGNSGSNGSRGRNGSYGKVILVPRSDIPEEKTSYQGQISQLLGKNIELVKNIWVKKKGLPSLLNAASDVPETYTYLQETARPKYKIAWNASSTPADLGVSDTEIGAAIKVENAKATIDFKVPGTLEYRQTKDKDVDIISITGGFSPSRIKSFEIENISGTGENTKLSLIDKGDVRKLLQASSIKVTLNTKQSASGQTINENYKFRHNMTFQIPPFISPSAGAVVSNNRYTLDMGSFFYPWLKPGYNAQFDVEITQKTKSGVVYTHDKSVTYNVPE